MIRGAVALVALCLAGTAPLTGCADDAAGDQGPTPAAGQVGGPLDGVWTMDTGPSASAPEHLDQNWGHWVFVLDRGEFAVTQENATSCTWQFGTYDIAGQRMSWTFADGGGIAPNGAMNKPGEHFVFEVTQRGNTVRLAAVEGAVSPLNFRARPWHRVSAIPSRDAFSKRCPPPPSALRR